MKKHFLSNNVNNEKGVAALIMIIFVILTMTLIVFNFITDSRQKHAGGAVTVTSNRALGIAQSGLRYAQKCMSTNDANCICNTSAPMDCLDVTGLETNSPYGPIDFGGGPDQSFELSFTEIDTCNATITSTGRDGGSIRVVEGTGTAQPGSVIALNNVLGTSSSTAPAIAANNAQGSTGSPLAATLTLSYTVPSGVGPDLVLVVAAGAETSGGGSEPLVPLPTGVTFGATPMNASVTSNTSTGGFASGVAFFWLAVTPGQSGTITSTYSSAIRNRTLHAVTLSNALQQAPEATAAAFNNGGDASASITTVTNGAMVISGGSMGNPNTLSTTGTSHTILNTQTPNSSAGAIGNVTVATAGLSGPYGFTSGGTNRMAVALTAFAPVPPNSISMAYTVPFGINNLQLVVVASAEGPTDTDTEASSATFGGNAMTKVGGVFATGSTYGGGVAMFRIAVSAGDSGSIIVTYPGATDERTLHAVTLSEVAAGAPEATEPEEIGSGSPTTITDSITTLTDGAMIITAGHHGNGNALIATGTNHTLNNNQTAASSAGALGSVPVPTAGLVSGIGWNPTTSPTNRMSLFMAAFAPFNPCP